MRNLRNCVQNTNTICEFIEVEQFNRTKGNFVFNVKYIGDY